MKKPMSNWLVMPMPPCLCTPSCTASVACILKIRIERLQRLQHRGAGDLDLDVKLRGAVLQRLEFADQSAELLALLEVADGATEHFPAEADHFLGHRPPP